MRRRLLVVAVILWVEMWIGTAVAVDKRLPYGLGGQGDPARVWQDFVRGGGTALSPPLFIVLLFGVLTVLAAWRGRAGLVGVAGLTLLAGLAVGTILGEPLVRRVLTPADAAFPETLLALASLVGAVVLLALGVQNLIDAIRGRRAPADAARA